MYLPNEKESFSNFGKNFQESLVNVLVQERQFADQIGEVLDYEYFDSSYLRKFVSSLYAYKQAYKDHPNLNVLQTIVNVEYPSEDLKNSTENMEVHAFFHALKKKVIEDGEREFVKAKALDFCRKQNVKTAMLRSWGLLKQSSFREIEDLIQHALKLGSDNNFGYDYLLDFEKRFQGTSRVVVPTPWEEINKITGGGHGKGELGIIIAPTGAGKSMILVSLGAHALTLGCNVVYYTLELRDTVIASRFDSCLTNIKLNDLCIHKQAVLDTVRKVPGRLIVKEYPTRGASVKTIENHLEKLKSRDFHPDLVLIDYGDILRSDSGRREVRHELGVIYEDMRGLAGQFNCALWSASQTNRSGLNAEIVTMDSISEAFNKCFIADFIIGASRTNVERRNNAGKFFIPKNRNGYDGITFPIYMDTASVTIDVLPRMEEEMEEIIEKSRKEEEQNNKTEMIESYQKYKKARKEEG